MNELEGRTALVTGASSGLGVDFARELGDRGAALVLVARREGRLHDVALELRQRCKVRVDVLVVDLGQRGAAQSVFDDLQGRGIDVDILVNNAGFGAHGDFIDLPWDREEQMRNLDILALVHLTKIFSVPMVARGWGRILQVASVGAFQPCPTYASYGAAKAFVLNFSEAFHFELRGSGVSCTVISPGATATEFLDVSGQKPTLVHRLTMMTSASVGRIGVRSLLAQKVSVVPGLVNKLAAFSARFTPRLIATWGAWYSMRAS